MRKIDDVLLRRGVITRSPFHDWNGTKEERWMTPTEAVCWLFVWRAQNVPKFGLYFPVLAKRFITSGVEAVYQNGMINQLIYLIQHSDEDPITVVARYHAEMDEILSTCDDDHFITHRFAGYMERASFEVLQYLKSKEKEMNE